MFKALTSFFFLTQFTLIKIKAKKLFAPNSPNNRTELVHLFKQNLWRVAATFRQKQRRRNAGLEVQRRQERTFKLSFCAGWVDGSQCWTSYRRCQTEDGLHSSEVQTVRAKRSTQTEWTKSPIVARLKAQNHWSVRRHDSESGTPAVLFKLKQAPWRKARRLQVLESVLEKSCVNVSLFLLHQRIKMINIRSGHDFSPVSVGTTATC